MAIVDQFNSNLQASAISFAFTIYLQFLLGKAVSACVVQDASPFIGDRNSIVLGISLPLVSSGCDCAENECVYLFTQLPLEGALYEMSISVEGDQSYFDRTSPKLNAGDIFRSTERGSFGKFMFVPSYKFYGSAIVHFNFSYNGLVSMKNFTVMVHLNNSVPYSGEGGHMLSFDGNDDFVVANVPTQHKLYGGFPALAFSFWVKNTKRRSGQVLISAWAKASSNNSAKWTGGRQWALFDTGNLNFQVNGISVSEGTGFNIRDSKWHFVCMSWKIKSGWVDIFVDGEKRTIPAPSWEAPDSMILMLGNMQLVSDIIPTQKAQNDVLIARSQESEERNLADSQLSPSYAKKWYAAQTKASALLSNLNGGIGSPKDAGSLAGIPSTYTDIHIGLVEKYRYAMFGIADCDCAAYGAVTKFAFGGYLDEFRMFNEAKDTIDFAFSANHMYTPTMFERYQSLDSAVATNSFASGAKIKALERLWIYWNFDYIYDFLPNDALPILENLRNGLTLHEARGRIDVFDARIQTVLDNTDGSTGVQGKLGDDYYSFRTPVRVVSDAPLVGSVTQYLSVFPDADFTIFKLVIEDWENQTNILIRIENMPVVGSLFQVTPNGSIGNPILARGAVITNSDLKVAYKGDKGLCKEGIKVFNVEGELVDKDTSADAFDVYIKDVKVIPPILDPDNPPALRFTKIVIFCALFRNSITMPDVVVRTLQNSSILFELQALSLEKPSHTSLVITQLPLRGSLWTTRWIHVSCNDTSVSCVCDDDPLECSSGWTARKNCNNETMMKTQTYTCLVANSSVIAGVIYDNPLNVIYSPTESFVGNDSVSFNSISKNSEGVFSQRYNEESATIHVIPKLPYPTATLELSAIPNITSGDCVNVSFNIVLSNVAEDSVFVRVQSFPHYGTLLIPSSPNTDESDSQGVPLYQHSKSFEITFDGFTKSSKINRIFPTTTATVMKNLSSRNFAMSGDPTSSGASYYKLGMSPFRGLIDTKMLINASQTFESVCGDLGVVQSYVEFAGLFAIESIRLVTSLPQDSYIRFVTTQNVWQGNSSKMKRSTQYSEGATKFENCPGTNCSYPWTYNVRQSVSEHPNLLKSESSFNYSQSQELFELWRGFAGEGNFLKRKNAIRDFSFPVSLPTQFLIIEICGTRKSMPGFMNGGNPIDEVQGLIVRVSKGGNRGILSVGIRTLMYRSRPTFEGQDRFELSLESHNGRVFQVLEAKVHVTKSRASGSKFRTNIQKSTGAVSTHVLMNHAARFCYEFTRKSSEDLDLFRTDSTAISRYNPKVFPDASGNVALKIGSYSRCGENEAFVFFRIVDIDKSVVEDGHNLSISFVCPAGLVCDSSVKLCLSCQPGTYYVEPSQQFNSRIALEVPSGYCLPCSPGYYADQPGQMFCKPCEPGFSSVTGSSTCTACDEGSFNEISGGLCKPCLPGQFQPRSGQILCHSCSLLGFSLTNNSIECLDCPENMHAEFEESSDVAQCTCNSGYYRLSRSNDKELMKDLSCFPCPLGAFCAGMDLLPVPRNGFWSDVTLWSSGKSYFLQCFHRGVLNQCQGYPTIDYQLKHEICKFRDTDKCTVSSRDVDTFRSYDKNLACSVEYSGFLCFECSEGEMLSSRNFVGACVLCPKNALAYVGLFVQFFAIIAMWIAVFGCLICRVHSMSSTIMHFQLLAVLSDAAVQNSQTVDIFLKGFHLFMFDLNFFPWSCVIRTPFPLFLKHVIQLMVFWGVLATIFIRGRKMVRDATLFRVRYNAQKLKISIDGINNLDRRSLRSRNTYNDQTSIADSSSVASLNSKGEARSWKNLFTHSQAEQSEIPVVELMRPNTTGSNKSHSSWYSKVSAWRKQHIKAEDAKLKSRKLMSTEEIEDMRDEQSRIFLAASQAFAVPIMYNTLVLCPCLEYSDGISRVMWYPEYHCGSLPHLIMSLIGVLTALWFVLWIPGKFAYQCIALWLQENWDQPQFLKQYRRIVTITERKHRWWFGVLSFHGPLISLCIITTSLQPLMGITAVLFWIGFKTILISYMRPYLMTKHNVYESIMDLHISIVCCCALYRTNIFSTSFLTFTLDQFEVSAEALDGLIQIVSFVGLLAAAMMTILMDCIYCKVKIPPWVAIVFNVLTGKPHAQFRLLLTDAWNMWQKLNRKYAKWIRPRTALLQYGKDVQRAECRNRADVVRDTIIAQNVVYPTESPFIFDTIEHDLGEWAAHPRKAYHFINACTVRIQELEAVNSKSDKILALQSKVNCALRCLINFNRLDYEDAFQRQYQLQGYAETLVWDIDVMTQHLKKLEIGIEGREAVGESTQQLMDHMGRRIPDMMNWRKRYEHERDQRLLIQKKLDELNFFMKQYMDSSDEDGDHEKSIPLMKEQSSQPLPPAGPRYRPAEPLPSFLRD